MKAHVICCNDEVKFVVLKDASEASEKQWELQEEDRQREKLYSGIGQVTYDNRYHWHIHTVEAL